VLGLGFSMMKQATVALLVFEVRFLGYQGKLFLA